MLLGELFLLCALDPMHGTVRPNRTVAHQPRFLATSLLMELAVCRELKRFEDGLHLDHDLPSFHILVDQVREAIKKAEKGFSPEQAIALVVHQFPHLRRDMLEALAERGILHSDGRRRYWLFGEKAYPIRSQQAEHECLELLEQAATGADRTLRAAAASLLATGSGLATILLHADQSNALYAWTRELEQDLSQPADSEDAPNAEAIAVMLSLSKRLSIAS